MCKTKIICTIGPSSADKEVFKKLVTHGLSVARLNLSHGNQEDYAKRIAMIREVREELKVPVAILMDTRGPEIRTKNFKNGQVKFETGQEIMIHNDDFDGDETKFCITYPTLYKDVHPGSTILIDDGLIELEVITVIDENIKCKVKNGGIVKSKKGINVPNVPVNLPAITDKDKEDILFGIKQDIDFVAASFIRTADDVLTIRKLLNENGGKNIQIISKIESQQGIDNIDEIIKVSDAIMIARGDLGVETPPELIPLTQKMLIDKCNEAAIPVITATQMLDSMINNPRPTRAEVSDVANAVFDGTDALMLSGETAAGAYPVESVQVMQKIADSTERSINYAKEFQEKRKIREINITNAVSYSTCSTAMNLDASAIICPTVSGRTAKMISKFKPSVPIIASTASEKTLRQMQLYWGVTPIIMQIETSSPLLFYKSIEYSKSLGLLKPDDLVVITAGIPLGVSGSTNLMKVQIVE